LAAELVAPGVRAHALVLGQLLLAHGLQPVGADDAERLVADLPLTVQVPRLHGSFLSYRRE
jgi:hypothetical protein